MSAAFLWVENYWFSKPVVGAGVTYSFRAHYNFPYMNWSEVPQTERDRWFLEFKAEYKEKLVDYNDKGVTKPPDDVFWKLLAAERRVKYMD